jgi:phospholipase C
MGYGSARTFHREGTRKCVKHWFARRSLRAMNLGPSGGVARADGNRNNVNHVIVIMQENHSFDNYFGVLPYVPGGAYHKPPGAAPQCPPNDHQCIDGLKCTRDALGNYTCSNSNLEGDGSPAVAAFHSRNYCPQPDLDHGWKASHQEANFSSPNDALTSSPNDGFARVNDTTEQHDTNTGESPTDDDTMGFYNEADLPYYYALAQTFATSDRYFCDVIGPTLPNRFYLAAATSFGHTTTSELIPPSGGYKPITGTLFDLLDKAGVQWVDYFSDLPQIGDFRTPTPPTSILPTIFAPERALGRECNQRGALGSQLEGFSDHRELRRAWRIL